MDVAGQLTLLEESPAPAERAPDPGADYGEVFTRRWVVDLILDLVGYTAERDLGAHTIVEPSCGTGAFLIPIVDRLIESSTRWGRDVMSLGPAVRAFDLLAANAAHARKALALRLEESGLTENAAAALARTWVTTGDFLLQTHVTPSADYVVGNPPYIRLESVPRQVMNDYRRLCPTMRGRSDVYIGFIERGLRLLAPEGKLGFICADRWMRNQYGADLRELVCRSFAVDSIITMHDVDAFHDDVSAYPAVVVLRNGPQQRPVVADATGSFGPDDATKLASWARRGRRRTFTTANVESERLDGWFEGRDLWPSGSPAQLAVLADLETRFPALETAGNSTRVGIGVATGCDDVYITTEPELVEADRLLPLLRSSDTVRGAPRWSGTYLVNPWDREGLVDLQRHPRLAEYLHAHERRLRSRHVARRRPGQWYRTIDRIDPDLLRRSKLVLPDLKASAHPVLDDGSYYPHHNLYFVVSDEWDLEVLGGLLLSNVANLFVGAYCVKMRGGCYRFQAQYLRRIRVPAPETISRADARALAKAFSTRDVDEATHAALRLYGLKEMPGV